MPVQRPAHPTGGRGIGPALPPGRRRGPRDRAITGRFTVRPSDRDNRRPEVVAHHVMAMRAESVRAAAASLGLTRPPRRAHPNSTSARAA